MGWCGWDAAPSTVLNALRRGEAAGGLPWQADPYTERMTFIRIPSGLLVGVLIALGAGCGHDSTTATTTSADESVAVQRFAAFQSFNDMLNKPGITETEAHDGTFDTSGGTCRYNESSAGNGWAVECESDSGQISRFRFTPSATASSNPGLTPDYIKRVDALKGFTADVLSDPNITPAHRQNGTFDVAGGTCQYHLERKGGWIVKCESDSGQISRHRFF